jgi:DNA-directed RNA polymerase specialized sigma24 family protein
VNPLDEYTAATGQMEAAQAEVKRLGDVRARALARLNAEGQSYEKIAGQVGTSRKNVQKLVERGRILLASETSSPRQG